MLRDYSIICIYCSVIAVIIDSIIATEIYS